jgi:hypothetical protein
MTAGCESAGRHHFRSITPLIASIVSKESSDPSIGRDGPLAPLKCKASERSRRARHRRFLKHCFRALAAVTPPKNERVPPAVAYLRRTQKCVRLLMREAARTGVEAERPRVAVPASWWQPRRLGARRGDGHYASPHRNQRAPRTCHLEASRSPVTVESECL